MSYLLTELTAVITEKLSHTIVLIFRNSTMRFIFESGNKIDSACPGDLDATIQFLTAPPSPLFGGQVGVHRVPAEATTSEQVLEWFQSIPEVRFEFSNVARA